MTNNTISTFPYPTCIVCDSKGTSKYTNLKDRHFGNSTGWNISECENEKCRLFWLDPMPTKEDIWKAYASYYTHSDHKKSILDFAFLEKPYYALKYGYFPEFSVFKKMPGLLAYLLPTVKTKFDFSILYLKAIEKGKVLDFGCGNGTFLDKMIEGNWEAYGLDVDPKAIDHCRSKGINANVGDIDSQNYPDNFFDVITINHVIEHVHEVDALLKSCYKVLKKGGKLVIATPNTESWQHNVYKEHWLQLDPPRHLHIFNINNLEQVVKRNDFSIVKSFSSSRIDAWSAIVSRGIKRNGIFQIGTEKKTKMDLFVGLFQQRISFILTKFNKRAGGEIILIATKK
jgi:methionine biosynthesis protein MetW